MPRPGHEANGLAHEPVDPLEPLTECRVLLDGDERLVEDDHVLDDDDVRVARVPRDLEVRPAERPPFSSPPRGSSLHSKPGGATTRVVRELWVGRDLGRQRDGQRALDEGREPRRSVAPARQRIDELAPARARASSVRVRLCTSPTACPCARSPLKSTFLSTPTVGNHGATRLSSTYCARARRAASARSGARTRRRPSGAPRPRGRPAVRRAARCVQRHLRAVVVRGARRELTISAGPRRC